MEEKKYKLLNNKDLETVNGGKELLLKGDTIPEGYGNTRYFCANCQRGYDDEESLSWCLARNHTVAEFID